MELELTADSEALGGLGRVAALAGSREGRPRVQAVKIVWHDSPEHALLDDGLTLAEQRGLWRLERVVPGKETWLPGQLAPVVAEAPDLGALPSPLAPLAAFEGRRTVSVHRFGEAAVTLTVEKGVLRAVASERSAARILLSGDEAAVQAAAVLIAEAVAATVPLASLAAEAIALATGQGPAVRRQGAPVLPDAAMGVPDALAHIIGHLTDVMLAFARHAAEPDAAGVEAVHQMRVALRRARSAVAVFRPALRVGALDEVAAGLKALGAQLGPVRDWDVFVEETMPAIQAALPADARLERLAAAAVRRRREHRAALASYLAGGEFRGLGIQLAWFVAAGAWRAPPEGETATLAAFSAGVLQHRWKKLVGAGKRMEAMDLPGLHGVRLRAKRARYAAEMFATLYPGKPAHRFIRRLGVLQQRLGVLNDGAVATHLLAELGGSRHAYAAGVVAGFLGARAGTIRPRIIVAFEKFRKQTAYWA